MTEAKASAGLIQQINGSFFQSTCSAASHRTQVTTVVFSVNCLQTTLLSAAAFGHGVPRRLANSAVLQTAVLSAVIAA